ncbi:alpha/beta hydrolase [Nocardia harenae]|uniref:alpha/beta hydrolase n=1 Tax=Nocardia harenae TaxID=358707 RepID=UPI00082C7E8B|nr:alpha/beta hydrolase fold domain-containing protein [Nocardia harenae]
MTQTTPIPEPTPARPPFDPELLPALEAYAAHFPRFSDETLPQLRAVMRDGMPGREKTDFTAGGAVVVEELTIPAGDAELELTVLRPAQGQGPWPLIYHTHGGGMITGTRYSSLEDLLAYAVEARAVVASIEYRLAPEHPDPIPVTDCYTGLRWCADHHEQLNIDPAHIIVTGASAGAGLAAGIALMARDQGYPQLTHQVLSAPMIDDRTDSASARMLGDEGVWDRNDNLYGWTALLGERRGTDDVSYYAAPARAKDLSGLPRTYIDVGAVETFRDPAIDYARRLSEAGIGVDLHVWGGAFHGFEAFPQAAVSQASITTRVEFFRRALER